MSDKLKELEAKVRECHSYDEGCKILVNGVADELDGLTSDPVAIKALAADLRASAPDLGAAICANCDVGEKEAKARVPDNKYGKGAEGAMNRAAAATVSPTTGKMQAAPQGEPECPAAQTQPEVSHQNKPKPHVKR